MNRVEIEQGHWVERYLAGRLSDSETRRFEAYWTEHPELTRDVENCARLKTGLVELQRSGELGALRRPSWWSGRLRLMALAASVAVVAVGALAWRGTTTLAPDPLLYATVAALPRLPGGGALPVGATLSLMRLRDARAVDAVVDLPAQPSALRLRVLPDVAAGPDAAPGAAGAQPVRWSARLARIDAHGAPRERYRLEGLVAAPDGFVDLVVDTRALLPGRYQLALLAGDPAEGGAFTIDVRRPPAQ
jgi:hypothetical protein